MTNDEDKIYLDKIDEIGNDVYNFYNRSDRKDLVMFYEMNENKIYSFIYSEYKNNLNAKSAKMLETQYQKAQESGRIVLFIRDEERMKVKSYII